MMKSCKYCGKIHPTNFVCPSKPKPKRHTDWTSYNQRIERRFRNTQAWKHKREEIRDRDHYLCRVCLDQDHTFNYIGIEVHHIISLVEDFDLRLDNDNLICVCRKHHEQAEAGTIEKKYLRELAKTSVEGVV